MKRSIIFVVCISVFLLMVANLSTAAYGQKPYAVQPKVSFLRQLPLGEPNLTSSISLEQVLAHRRSVREFTKKQLNLQQISQLAWAGQGITEKVRGFRTAPSAGAIYPMKLYFIVPGGMYIYNPSAHSLQKLLIQDLRPRLAAAALKQDAVAKAACDIIIAGSAQKIMAKYGDRGRMYMLIEAGHIAQNIHLQAVSLGLGSVPIGAFEPNEVSKVCRLPADLEPIYIIAVGYPAGRAPAQLIEIKKDKPEAESPRGKKAVFIISQKRFRDDEFFDTQDLLQAAGVETTVASSKLGPVKGLLRSKAEATILLNDINVDDYDAIVFIGGVGPDKYFTNPVVLNIVRQAADKGKVLAAIGNAPRILANARVLAGVRVTSNPSAATSVTQAGALYTKGAVERDGLIVTARSQALEGLANTSAQFARAIIDALEGRPEPQDEDEDEEAPGRYVPRRVKRRRDRY